MSYNLLTVSQKIDRLIAVGASKQAIELLKTFWEKEAAATKAAEEATKRQQESYERMLAGLSPVEKAQMKTRENEENEAEIAWLGDSTRND